MQFWDRTYIMASKASNFKSMGIIQNIFILTYKNLRATRGKIMRSAGNHQENILVSQVLIEVKNMQNTVLQAIRAHSYEENEENEPPSGHNANTITIGDDIQLDNCRC